MSNAVLPSLPGVTWSKGKQPQWSTKIQQAVSGREVRAAFRVAPLYKFSLTYEVLRELVPFSEIQSLIGFFNLRQGSFDSFLYTDPSDNAVTAQSFGVGDGVQTVFSLTRSYGGHAEYVANLNGAPSIFKSGVLTSAYTINDGIVTFNPAPLAASALTWTGSYYYRARFMSDTLDFDNIMSKLWALKKLEFLACLGTKIR